MEQLSGLDATFLYMESSTNFGHVGGIQIFRNAESQRISVVYKRKDGNFGLIEP